MGLLCDSVHYTDSATQLTVKTGAVQAGAKVYDPYHIAARLDGPATISTGDTNALGFDWNNLRADLRLATDFPEYVSLEADKFAAQARSDSATANLVSFGHGEIHMRRNGEDLDLAASFSDTAVDPQLTPGTQLPPFAADADLSVKDGVAWARAGASSLRGQSGTIRTLALSLDPTTGLSLTGSFSVADDCLLSADLKLLVRNPKALAEQLAKAMPASANQVRMVFSAMSEGMAWPLKISGGKAMFGAISIPPLCDATAS